VPDRAFAVGGTFEVQVTVDNVTTGLSAAGSGSVYIVD
jgi:hypothetical protein